MGTYNIADYGAVGDGVTNDAGAFLAFKAAAVSDPDVTLNLGSGLVYAFTTTTARDWVKGFAKLLVLGNGSTLKNAVVGGVAFFLGGRGLVQDNSHHARIQTAARGAVEIVLIDPTKYSLFTVGRYVVITGFDVQGIYGAPFGFPPNPHYFQYAKVTSIDSVGGILGIDTPLAYTYKSTWPHFADGTAFEIDQGGPATVYALDSSWDLEVEYRDLTIDNTSFQTYANARSVTYRNCPMLGVTGAVPSQNMLWQAIDSDFSGCNVEIDKMVNTVSLQGSTFNHIKVQSSSIDNLEMDDCTATSDVTGTAKRCQITNSTIGTFQPGVYGYGASSEVNISGCAVTTLQGGGFVENVTTMGLHMANGVIYYRNGAIVTGAADNGSGKVRLTVDSAVDFVTGQKLNISSVGGTFEANNGLETANATITVVDGTHVDLLNVNFVHTYTSGGKLGNKAPRWAIPGSTCFFIGSSGATGFHVPFRILDVTQDADYVYVQTNLSGGFPPMPGTLQIATHPAPRITCRSCTGSADILDLNNAPAGAPIFSYSKRTYVADASGTTAKVKSTIWGPFKSAQFTVTDDYVGAGSLTFKLSAFGNWTFLASDQSTTSSFAPIINMKAGQGSARTILAASTSGGQAGDTLAAPGAGCYFGDTSNSGPVFSANVTNGETPTIEVEITSDQGVASLFAPPLRLRLHA